MPKMLPEFKRRRPDQPAMATAILLAMSIATPLLRGSDGVVRYEASHNAMATEYTVVAYGSDREYLAEVVNEVFEEIDRLDAQLSNYKPDSELSYVNRAAADQSVVVEPGLFRLIQDSLRFSEETDGAFDITVGPLMKAWGFFRGQGRLPTRAEITQILQRVGYRHVKLDPALRTVRFNENGIELDLGGIAKGYAVDRAVEILRENGVNSALVSSGTSSIYALGSPPGARAWRVTLRDPYDGKKIGNVILLRNYSVSTSANYERFFVVRGKTYGHLMDPHTGMPVEGILTAAVLAPSACQSDALTKSLFVLGVDGIGKYLDTHRNLIAVFYVPSHTVAGYETIIRRSPSFALSDGAWAEIEETGSTVSASTRKSARGGPSHDQETKERILLHH
jgi:FAD:protein FMN transferase